MTRLRQLEAVLIALGGRPCWSEAKRFLSSAAAGGLTKRLRCFNPNSLTPSKTARLERYVRSWDVDRLRASSAAIPPLAQWVEAVYAHGAAQTRALTNFEVFSYALAGRSFPRIAHYQPTDAIFMKMVDETPRKAQ